jgi:hypothetical protein
MERLCEVRTIFNFERTSLDSEVEGNSPQIHKRRLWDQEIPKSHPVRYASMEGHFKPKGDNSTFPFVANLLVDCTTVDR